MKNPFLYWSFSAMLGLLPFINTTPVGQHQENTEHIAVKADSVQRVLKQYARQYPDRVTFLSETQRWYLNTPRTEAHSEKWVEKLQVAYYYDVEAICRFYGEKYLIDWRVLAAKSARETFWGASYLANQARNYFGIRRTAKDWICESFYHCDVVERPDPDLAKFVVFPDFESALWMFIHTIYSAHYLERLPDGGQQVAAAIDYERRYHLHYWQTPFYGKAFSTQLEGLAYSPDAIFYTWSGHEKNNLCATCTLESDQLWLEKWEKAVVLAKGK